MQPLTRNAGVVARAYRAFNEADLETLAESFDENAEWATPGESTAAGDRRGRDSVFAQFERYEDETGGTFEAELKFVAEDDEGRVIAFHHNRAMRNGRRLDTDCCIVFEVKDGRITKGSEHFFDLYNWDEFWS
jgi:ketosteroid isomerase-like protein